MSQFETDQAILADLNEPPLERRVADLEQRLLRLEQQIYPRQQRGLGWPYLGGLNNVCQWCGAGPLQNHALSCAGNLNRARIAQPTRGRA